MFDKFLLFLLNMTSSFDKFASFDPKEVDLLGKNFLDGTKYMGVDIGVGDVAKYEKERNAKRVYELIDRERNYQDSKNTDWCHEGCPSVAEELLLAEHYLTERARKAWVTEYGNPKAGLKELVKVAAIIVRCLEHHYDV